MTQAARPPRARDRAQRGSTMLVVMAILLALLAGGGIALYLQLSDTRAAGLVKSSRDALFCAEAGLAAARPLVGTNYALWGTILDNDPDNDPNWYPIRGDLDDPPDGVDDYEVTVRDNDDEAPPAANDRTVDNDLRVFVVSRCLTLPETPREVMELIRYQGGGSVYRNQAGQGQGNTGNTN